MRKKRFNKQRRKGEKPKLQPKFVSSCDIVEYYSNQAYKTKLQEQWLIQNDTQLKLYTPCLESLGRSPVFMSPHCHLEQKGLV